MQRPEDVILSAGAQRDVLRLGLAAEGVQHARATGQALRELDGYYQFEGETLDGDKLLMTCKAKDAMFVVSVHRL